MKASMKANLQHTLILVAIAAAGLSSCKKKSSTSPTSAPRTVGKAVDLEEGCQAELALVKPLPKVNPEQLKLADAKISQYLLGSYKAAELSFALDPASAVPDTIIYKVCATGSETKCQFGASASPVEYNALLPEGAIKMQAWACIGPERLLKAGASRLEITEFGEYYCGRPFTAYGHQSSNAGGAEFAKAQAEIEGLKQKAKQVAFEIQGIVSKYIGNDQSQLGLVAIANAPKEVVAETALYLYSDVKKATDYQATKQQLGTGFKLASTSSNCVPTVNDADVTGAFLPEEKEGPFVAAPGAVSGGTVSDPSSKEKPSDDMEDAVSVVATETEATCKARSEAYTSKGLGTASWDVNLQKCFHVNNEGVKQEIDASTNSGDELVEGPGEGAEASKSSSKGSKQNQMDDTRKSGIAFLALGSALAVGGGALWVSGGGDVKQIGSDIYQSIIGNKGSLTLENLSKSNAQDAASVFSSDTSSRPFSNGSSSWPGAKRGDRSNSFSTTSSVSDLTSESGQTRQPDAGQTRKTVGGWTAVAGVVALVMGGILFDVGAGLAETSQNDITTHQSYIKKTKEFHDLIDLISKKTAEAVLKQNVIAK